MEGFCTSAARGSAREKAGKPEANARVQVHVSLACSSASLQGHRRRDVPQELTYQLMAGPNDTRT